MKVLVLMNNDKFAYPIAELARDSALIFDDLLPIIINPLTNIQINSFFELPGLRLREGVTEMTSVQCHQFAAHFLLWEQCVKLNEPIIIVDQNTIFVRNFEIDKLNEILILDCESIVKGYAITPLAAEKLMLEAFEVGINYLQNFINDSRLIVQRSIPPIIQQQLI
jgi:hypothetical protein